MEHQLKKIYKGDTFCPTNGKENNSVIINIIYLIFCFTFMVALFAERQTKGEEDFKEKVEQKDGKRVA